MNRIGFKDVGIIALSALAPGIGARPAAAQVAPTAVTVPVGGFTAGVAGGAAASFSLKMNPTALREVSLCRSALALEWMLSWACRSASCG